MGMVQFVGLAMASMTLYSPSPVVRPADVALYGYRYTPVDTADARLARMAAAVPVTAASSMSAHLTLSQRISPPSVVIYTPGRHHHHSRDISICGDVVTQIRS